ncbi:hypothetical protein GCM10010844_43730 [Deinococcus radiotolerans]|uniref:Uncharacterized protein n=1 Tax=Deinococcus radiotolerans TaxID=1309407 RepID=A0ABQ2FRQ0_9DEIO|nr:hypothetical protein GCM10010844_43730 [Deinococcus radiotolerans]
MRADLRGAAGAARPHATQMTYAALCSGVEPWGSVRGRGMAALCRKRRDTPGDSCDRREGGVKDQTGVADTLEERRPPDRVKDRLVVGPRIRWTGAKWPVHPAPITLHEALFTPACLHGWGPIAR